MINKFFIKSALKLMPRTKQQALFANALNYLFGSLLLDNLNQKVIKVEIEGTTYAWKSIFDENGFTPSEKASDIQLILPLDDVSHIRSLKNFLSVFHSNKIKVVGVDKEFIILLLSSVSEIKLNSFFYDFKNILKYSLTNNVNFLFSLTIKDIKNIQDIDFIRDQALLCENSNPKLAYYLMNLAYTAKPNGPLINRKLREYRLLGFDKSIDSESSIKLIPALNSVLGYCPIPKTACTSIKTALYECCENRQYTASNHNGKHVHDYWLERMKPCSSFKSTLIVVRDPIERFLSAYASRVLDHNELNRYAVDNINPILSKSLPYFRPNLNQFIEQLEIYMRVPSIHHHCQPLSEIVDHDLSRFTHIIPINEIQEAEKLFSEHLKREIKIPHEHAGKNKISLKELTKNQLDFLMDFYSDDYRLLEPWYSKEQIREKWNHLRNV